MCCAAGCDTDIPTDEIKNDLTAQTRCAMTGGIPLTSTQVQSVRKIIEETNEDIRKETISSIYEAIGYQGGDDITYGSKDINILYQYAYTLESPPGDNLFCACGTDVCDADIACDVIGGNKACRALDINVSYDDDNSCDIVHVDNRMFAYLLSSTLFPILVQAAKVRLVGEINSQYAICLAEKKCGDDNCEAECKQVVAGNNNIENVEDVDYALHAFAQLASSTGFDSITTKSFKTEVSPDEDAYLEYMNWISTKLMFAAIAECINVGTSYCPDGMLLYIPGIPNSVSVASTNKYYNLFKEIAEHLRDDGLIKNDLDEFFIRQAGGLLFNSVELSSVLSVPNVMTIASKTFVPEGTNILKWKSKPSEILLTDVSVAAADGLLMVLRDVLTASYNRYGDYEAHRLFLGHAILQNMLGTDKDKLFALTFRQNSQCNNYISPIGHVYGVNKYCYSKLFTSGVLTFEGLANRVLADGQEGEDHASGLADAMIMGNTFALPLENVRFGKNEIFVLDKVLDFNTLFKKYSLNALTLESIESVEIYKIDIEWNTVNDRNVMNAYVQINSTGNASVNISIPLKGEWLINRCPMGASCTVNNECGICANSAVVRHYGKGYERATCENGLLVQQGI